MEVWAVGDLPVKDEDEEGAGDGQVSYYCIILSVYRLLIEYLCIETVHLGQQLGRSCHARNCWKENAFGWFTRTRHG